MLVDIMTKDRLHVRKMLYSYQTDSVQRVLQTFFLSSAYSPILTLYSPCIHLYSPILTLYSLCIHLDSPCIHPVLTLY
jgi:hypothetical protein